MLRGLHSLSIKNFQILGDIVVNLRRLNVLVGPNGSGKSTLLRVIQFLGDAARSQLATAVEGHGGIQRVHTRQPTSEGENELDWIVISVKAVVTRFAHAGALDEYTLLFRPMTVPDRSDSSPRVGVYHHESFKFKRTSQAGRRITLRDGKLTYSDDGKKEKQQKLSLDKETFGLAVLPQLGPEQGGAEIRKIQELFTKFRVFDVDTVAARMPSDTREPIPLRPNASNLAAFLQFLHEKHRATFASLVADARAIVPGLGDVRLRVVGGAGDAVAIDIVDIGIPGTTPLADASFGTVRALAMLAMLYDPSPPLVTCIEEIDHGFHPHVFDRLVELLRVASKRTQFLIATHSPALVNRLAPNELIVCERDSETGLARIPAVDPTEIEAIAAASDYRLGELWFSGTLGGVPK